MNLESEILSNKIDTTYFIAMGEGTKFYISTMAYSLSCQNEDALS